MSVGGAVGQTWAAVLWMGKSVDVVANGVSDVACWQGEESPCPCSR